MARVGTFVNGKNYVVAGVTADFPAIVDILETVLNIPNGEIYFSNVDYNADEDYWDAIDETHPQFEIKELLKKLKLNRNDIKNICLSQNIAREKLVSEIMRPAIVSDNWRNLNSSFNATNAISGIKIINCNSQRDEALVIALKLREILKVL